MKKLILIVAIAFLFSSCKKTEETYTMLGNWEVDSYRENGVDKTTLYKSTYINYVIKYDASGNYIETYTLLGVNTTNAGQWILTSGGASLELTSQVDSTMRFFDVIELNSSSATLTEDNGAKSFNLRKI